MEKKGNGTNGICFTRYYTKYKLVKRKNTFIKKTYIYSKSHFFEFEIQLGRVTRLLETLHTMQELFKDYNLSRKLVQTGKLSRSETRELSYLGMDLEDC